MFMPPVSLPISASAVSSTCLTVALMASRHQVFQHLNVVRIHGLGLDRDGQHLVLAIHLDGDHLTGGAAGVLGSFQLSLLGRFISSCIF